MNSIQFEFDELPLVIENGFEAALVAGSAEISYHRDGEWSIRHIYSDGFRLKSQEQRDADLDWALATKKPIPSIHQERMVELDPGTPLYLIIYHRLEHEWRDKVQDAVNEALAEDREYQADDYADYRRDERKHVGAV